MLCAKNIETVHVKSASNVCATQEGSVFLDYLVSMSMSEVLTKRFALKCTHLFEHRQPHPNPLLAKMVRWSAEHTHLPPFRERGVMIEREELYNDLMNYLQDKSLKLEVDDSASLGDGFIKHLTYALFPLI
jgi:hypothetical protein